MSKTRTWTLDELHDKLHQLHLDLDAARDEGDRDLEADIEMEIEALEEYNAAWRRVS